METKDIMSKFDELYQKMATSGEQKYMNVFGDTMKRMMSDMVELKPELAKEYLDRLCSINWDNYLTKKEAINIVSLMNPKAAWNMQDWVDSMENAGLHMEEAPYYNDYALYVVMNQVVSDHGETFACMLDKKSLNDIEPKELTKTAYKFAIDLLKDEDKAYNIREYFLK